MAEPFLRAEGRHGGVPAAGVAVFAGEGYDDWPGLLALLHRAFAVMRGRIDPPSSLWSMDAAALAGKASAERLFLAVSAGRTVGCVFCQPRSGVLYVGKLAVDPPWQGRGIGRALMARADDEARALGLTTLELQTRIELTENHAAFAAMGFVRTGETAHPGCASATSATMRKVLR